MTVILSILLIQKAVHGWYILISPILYVHISLDLLLTLYPLANIGKDSSRTNCIHIHMARLLSRQELIYYITANGIKSYGTLNESFSKIFSYSSNLIIAHSAFKKTSHRFIFILLCSFMFSTFYFSFFLFL